MDKSGKMPIDATQCNLATPFPDKAGRKLREAGIELEDEGSELQLASIHVFPLSPSGIATSTNQPSPFPDALLLASRATPASDPALSSMWSECAVTCSETSMASAGGPQ
ncbi:hypothetical protein AB5N19_06827 [Seiridium cardinale]